MNKLRDVVVIGAGLSGVSAALKAAQAGLKVIALSKPNDPGYWARTGKLTHLPGAAENTNGRNFLERARKQAESFTAAFQELLVTTITQTTTNTYIVSGTNGDAYEAPVVIIASGVSKDEHFLAGEREFVGKGVFYSAKNDAPLLKHQSATIIGRSEEAALAAGYLSKFAEKIYFVIPSSKLDISEKLLHELEANKKIELIFSSSIKKLNGTEDLHSITILNAGNERELKSKAAFIYTYGLKPCSDFAKELVKVEKNSGRILVNSEFSTSKPGIFACGDVLAGELQNPIVSEAQGIIAAINAENLLSA